MVTAATYSVLLVEDNPADIYLIQQAVQECGNDIWLWTIMDGPEALMFLRKDPPLAHVPTPALIVLDLNLPKLSGRELLPKIRQLPAHTATPIVVFSSAPKEYEETRCWQLGATTYVQKAMNYDVYFNSVKAIMQQWLRRVPVQ